MLRDMSLLPLSRQHHAALALCVRIERELKQAAPDLEPWGQEIERIFQDEIQYHFEAEEKFVFPAARAYPSLNGLVEELLAEHEQLRGYRARAAALPPAELNQFSHLLSGHIRREERELFEQMQALLPPLAMERLGSEIERYFLSHGNPGQACVVPMRPPQEP
jgi:hemerythrin-like domain-containing protein